MIQPCDKSCANKAKSGYCATTVCINPKYSNIGTAYFPSGVPKQIVTNAMKIRAMTDEKLAEWISCNCVGDGYGNSAEDWLEWLKEKVNDGKEEKEENQPAK